MFLFTFPILIVKWRREYPPRPPKVWAMDVSKQICSFVALTLLMIGMHALSTTQTALGHKARAPKNLVANNTGAIESKNLLNPRIFQ